jgi:hypothetical protein
MLSRALRLATVMLLIGGFAAAPARAQNLEAGKSPSQIFSGTCAACHKGARGLLKTVAPGSLPGFLRQHYTTSSEMASVLSAYLVSNGAADTRYTGSQPKQGKDAKQDARPSGAPEQLDRFGRPIRRAPAQEASRPDGDGRLPQGEPGGRQGRNRLANPDAARPAGEGQTPAATAEERGPDGRKLSAKQRLSKRGKPIEELPRTDAPKTDTPMGEAAKGEVAKDEKSNAAKDEASKPEVKPEEEKSESARLDDPKGEGARSDVPLRADPVPAVTPAPKSPEGEAGPAELASPPGGSPSDAPASASASNAAALEPQGGGSTAAAPPAPVALSPPPLPPVAPAGPPVPPISQ